VEHRQVFVAKRRRKREEANQRPNHTNGSMMRAHKSCSMPDLPPEISNQQVKDLIDFLVTLNGIRQQVFVPKDD
jgi:hypothetical protein